MKKILLSVAAIAAISAGVNAQVYSANNAAAFGTWSSVDLDGDGNNWGGGDLTGAGTVHDAQGECLISNSWVTAGPLTPDNLAISPVIDLSGTVGVTLNFKVGSVETTASGWYEEHYAVYVVTDLVAIMGGTFPTPILDETLAGGETMYTKSLNITAAAAGQSTVYIVFRHYNCTDENFIILDDLTVTGDFASVEENNLSVSVYPNPAVDVLNLSFNTDVQVVTIYSLSGQVMATVEVNALTAMIDVAALAPGVYFYEAVTSEGTRARNTFVKK